MPKPTVEEVLAPNSEVRSHIYAYSIADETHQGLLKVGQKTRDVKQRDVKQRDVKQHVVGRLKTTAIKNFQVALDESAGREDGAMIIDHQVRTVL